MATIAFGALGAAIGSLPGGTTVALGWQLGTFVGGLVDAASQPKQEIGKVSDLRFGGSAYGSVFPRAWGRVRVPGVILLVKEDANGNHLIAHKSSAGGKGGMSGPTVYTYTTTCVVGFTQASIYARDPSDPLGGEILYREPELLRVWADDVLKYDESTPDDKKKWRLGEKIQILPGSEDQAVDSILQLCYSPVAEISTPALRGLFCIALKDIELAQYGNRIPTRISCEVDFGPCVLSDIIGDLLREAGIQASQMDLTAADSIEVRGYVEAAQQSPLTSVQALCDFYGLVIVESDGKIRLLALGADPVATIQDDDLGASTGDNAPKVTRRRRDSSELPGKVEVQYNDIDLDQQEGKQQALGPAFWQGTNTISTPLTLDKIEAKQAAQRWLDRLWSEVEEFEFSLLPKWTKLVPGDVVSIPSDGSWFRVRLTSVEIGAAAEIRCKAVLDSSQIVPGSGSGVDSDGSGAGSDDIVSTDFYAWSGREIQDADQSRCGFYVAASGDAGWSGGDVYYSPDAGTTWIFGGTVLERSVFGETTGTLSDSGAVADSFDDSNTVGVDVGVSGGELDTVSDVEISAGINHAWMGTEILGVGAATLTGSGLYTLSHLRRGERSTPMSGHSTSEPFVLLSSALLRVSVAEDLAGDTVKVKVVADGETLADVDSQDVLIMARTVVPATPDSRLPSPLEAGQFLVCADGSTWVAAFPVVDSDGFILTTSDGRVMVTA